MYELSLTKSLMDLAVQHSDNRPVKILTLELGLLSCVDAGALHNCFESIKSDFPLLDEAKLKVNPCRPHAHCHNCQSDFSLLAIGQPCECGSFNYDLSGGDQLTLSAMEF